MRAAILAIVSGFALSLSTAAFADDTQSGAVPQQVSATDDSQQLICHHIVHEGVMTKAVTCHTQREWDKIRINDQKVLSDWQTRALTNLPR